jgi:hypothetical protein
MEDRFVGGPVRTRAPRKASTPQRRCSSLPVTRLSVLQPSSDFGQVQKVYDSDEGDVRLRQSANHLHVSGPECVSDAATAEGATVESRLLADGPPRTSGR